MVGILEGADTNGGCVRLWTFAGARLQLDNTPFEPGTTRRIGFVFLSTEGAEAMKRVGLSYLWEDRVVGEARVVE